MEELLKVNSMYFSIKEGSTLSEVKKWHNPPGRILPSTISQVKVSGWKNTQFSHLAGPRKKLKSEYATLNWENFFPLSSISSLNLCSRPSRYDNDFQITSFSLKIY